MLLGGRQAGKAPGFGPGIRRFESFPPSHRMRRERIDDRKGGDAPGESANATARAKGIGVQRFDGLMRLRKRRTMRAKL